MTNSSAHSAGGNQQARPEAKVLGFLGAGNMAEALMRALLASNLATPASVVAYDPRDERQRFFQQELGVRTVLSPEEVLDTADVVILAFKPQDAESALRPIQGRFQSRHLVVSMLAGTSTRYLEALLPAGVRVVRVMPNLLLAVGAGAAGLSPGRSASEADVAFVRRMFEAGGRALVVPEDLLDVVTALSGSGPAYFFYVIEALVEGAANLGLPPDIAQELAEATCLGAGKLLLERGGDPAQWRQRVASKGGTTEAALQVLEQAHVRQDFVQAVAAAARRSRELGR
jgi:pyrroline-5-carboxylate reductase